MEFSFGPKRWFPKESLPKRGDHIENYSLGLHAPGFFDKVLNIDKCLLQSEPANLVSFAFNFDDSISAYSHVRTLVITS